MYVHLPLYPTGGRPTRDTASRWTPPPAGWRAAGHVGAREGAGGPEWDSRGIAGPARARADRGFGPILPVPARVNGPGEWLLFRIFVSCSCRACSPRRSRVPRYAEGLYYEPAVGDARCQGWGLPAPPKSGGAYGGTGPRRWHGWTSDVRGQGTLWAGGREGKRVSVYMLRRLACGRYSVAAIHGRGSGGGEARPPRGRRWRRNGAAQPLVIAGGGGGKLRSARSGNSPRRFLRGSGGRAASSRSQGRKWGEACAMPHSSMMSEQMPRA